MSTASRFAVLLLLPALLFAVGAMLAEATMRWAAYAAPEPATLLDAAAVAQQEALFRMVSQGDDPGEAVELKRPVLHWKKGDVISPFLVTVAGGQPDMVAYLANHTKGLNTSPNDRALCVAARYGHFNVAEFLMKRGVPPVPQGGCGKGERPEDVAIEYGSGRLAEELRRYRLNSR